MKIFEGIISCIVAFYLVIMGIAFKVNARRITFKVLIVKFFVKVLPMILGLLCLIFALELFGVVVFL